MGRWVDEQYESALAFVFISITALLPASFSIGNADPFGRIITLRWWVGDVVIVQASSELSGWRWVHDAILLQEGTTVFTAYLVWALCVISCIALFVFGVVLFVNEEKIRNRVRVTNVTGACFILISGTGIASMVLESLNGIPGTYVPVGTLFAGVFGVIMLTNRL